MKLSILSALFLPPIPDFLYPNSRSRCKRTSLSHTHTQLLAFLRYSPKMNGPAHEGKRQRQRQQLDRHDLHEPSLARLYWGVARMDAETQVAILKNPGLKKLVPYAPVVDFYGSHLRIHNGRVIVPGGARAEAGWRELVGAGRILLVNLFLGCSRKTTAGSPRISIRSRLESGSAGTLRRSQNAAPLLRSSSRQGQFR